MKISKNLQKIEKSGTVKFTNIVKTLKNQGKDIIDFSVGQSDQSTPIKIIEATKKALDLGKTKYSDVSGLPELKKQIVKKLNNENQISCSTENIIVTNGAKQGLFEIFQTILNPGDEIILIAPFYVSFKEQIKSAGAKPVIVKTIQNRLDLNAIKKAINSNTKAIVINSPCNPTGAVIPKSKLEQLGKLAINNDILIISDETYENYVFDNLEHVSIASLSQKISQHTLTVFSFSKTYSMAGFRIGYVVAPKKIIEAMEKLHSHLTGNVCTFAQWGALAALKLENPDSSRKLFEKRRDMTCNLASEIFDFVKPQGGFYIFADVSKHLNNETKTSTELVEKLLKKANVVCVPGEIFGQKNHIRIAYTVNQKKIKQGFCRMKQVLSEK
ncbi:MAG: Aromatic-amino-acid aminotransferase 2 [Candidatus Woesearchaeota archaeon]|nr:Aromatic-amino-acid aminotransferase 2 [Candidatus Woesearchaeota archaeon]